MTPEDDYPVFPGIYRAIVQEVRGQSLKVVVPAVSEEALEWALPCFPLLIQQPVLVETTATGGDAYHAGHPVVGKTEKITIRAPKRGTSVWVMFEEGDPDRPVWLGSWLEV
jgi:hypothetical protein